MSKLHPLIKVLTSVTNFQDKGWAPICYEMDGGSLVPQSYIVMNESDFYRIECYIQESEQYVFVERKNLNDNWSHPEFGESSTPPPRFGYAIACSSLRDCAMALEPYLTKNKVHPLVWHWYKYLELA